MSGRTLRAAARRGRHDRALARGPGAWQAGRYERQRGGAGVTSPVRVVVADDQAAVREGLVIMLDLLDDVEVVGQAADGDEAIRLVDERDPDVVLMDLRMPRCDGATATGRIRAAHPAT